MINLAKEESPTEAAETIYSKKKRIRSS